MRSSLLVLLLVPVMARGADVPAPPEGTDLSLPGSETCTKPMGMPKGLSSAQIRKGLGSLAPAMEVCRSGRSAPGQLETTLQVACTGRVTSVNAYAGSDWDPAAIACVMDVLHYAPFNGHDQSSGVAFTVPVGSEIGEPMVAMVRAVAGGSGVTDMGPAADIVMTDVGCSDTHFADACADSDDPVSCATWANVLLMQDGGCYNADEAREMFSKVCVDRRSLPSACSSLGQMFEDGLGGERDRTRAVAFYEWACEANDAHACLRRGVLLNDGTGVRRNDTLAVSSLEKACELGEADGCYRSGVILDEGTLVSREPDRAAELYGQACSANEGQACVALGQLREGGDLSDGVDLGAARGAYELGISAGSLEAQRRLAKLLWNGLGGKPDKRRSKELCREACQGGDNISCRGPAFL